MQYCLIHMSFRDVAMQTDTARDNFLSTRCKLISSYWKGAEETFVIRQGKTDPLFDNAEWSEK